MPHKLLTWIDRLKCPQLVWKIFGYMGVQGGSRLEKITY